MYVTKMVVVALATVTMVIVLVKVSSMLHVNQRPIEEEEKDEGVMV